MGRRSFVIKFDSIEQIKQFYKWRKYLAHLVSENYDKNLDYKDYNNYISIGYKINLEEYYNDYGDFDLYLEGLMFWAGAIWGLIGTQTVGETTFYLFSTKILDAYSSRLMLIDSIHTDFDNMESLNIQYELSDKKQLDLAIRYFNKIYIDNKDSLLDYDNIILKNNLVKDVKDYKIIPFRSNKYFKLFNIKKKDGTDFESESESDSD